MLKYLAIAMLFIACAAIPARQPKEPTDQYAVTTVCWGPKGVIVDKKGNAYEIYACLEGVLMFRPTTVAEAPSDSEPSKD